MLLCVATLTVVTACGNTSSTSIITTSSSSATTNQMSTSETNSDYFSDKDLDSSYDESTASKISLSGSTASVDGDGVSVEGSTVTISAGGTYIVSGTSQNVQIVVNAPDTDDVQIVLNGVTMTGEDALIRVDEADNVYITLADGSTNSLADSANSSSIHRLQCGNL